MPPPWEAYSTKSGGLNSIAPLSQQNLLQRNPAQLHSTTATVGGNSQRIVGGTKSSPSVYQQFNPPLHQQHQQHINIHDRQKERLVEDVGRITKNIHDYYTTTAQSNISTTSAIVPPANEVIMNRAKQQVPQKIVAHGQITGEGGVPTFKLGGTTAPQLQQGVRAKTRWSVDQLRATDAMIPSQMGTNQFASQKGMTGFGTPRNTTTPVSGGVEDVQPEPVIPLQYGTNQFASQKGMTGFGSPRDVGGKHLHRLLEEAYPEYAPANIQGQAVH